jgi:hypothetical protein
MKNNSNIKNLLILIFSFCLVVAFFIGLYYKGVQNQNKDEWISVWNSENESVYYNPSKIIHTQNGNVKMWIKLTGESERDRAIKMGAEHGISAEKYNNWVFDEALAEFDCENKNMRFLDYLSYDADGKIIYEEDHTTDSFFPVVPDSNGEKLYKLACENQSFLCRLPFICE